MAIRLHKKSCRHNSSYENAQTVPRNFQTNAIPKVGSLSFQKCTPFAASYLSGAEASSSSLLVRSITPDGNRSALTTRHSSERAWYKATCCNVTLGCHRMCSFPRASRRLSFRSTLPRKTWQGRSHTCIHAINTGLFKCLTQW